VTNSVTMMLHMKKFQKIKNHSKEIFYTQKRWS
jgi:hypothetical protein